MIKAVILDFGGTLAGESPDLDIFSERSVKRLLMEGIEIDADDFKNAFLDTVEWRMTFHPKGIEVDSHQFLGHVVETFGHKVSRDITDELEMILVTSGEPKWLTDVEDLLIKLSSEYKVALLSNAWLEAPRQILRDYGWGRWFDVMVVSYDVGIPKPDPRIFQHTLNLLGVEPHEAVMVGNSLHADINGATDAGLHAIWTDYEGVGGYEGYTVNNVSEVPDLLKRPDFGQ